MNGLNADPYAVERVETSRGKVIYQAPKTKTAKVMDTHTAAVMTAMLKTVIKSGTGVAANIGKPAAGKTGTTDDSKDACFIGYTPDIVTGVWVGNDDNTKNGKITGGTVPALIWKEVMAVATIPYGASDFDYPPVELKNYSGNRKTEDTEQRNKDINAENVEEAESVTIEQIDASMGNSKEKQTTVTSSVPAKPEKKQSAPLAPVPVPMATPSGIEKQ